MTIKDTKKRLQTAVLGVTEPSEAQPLVRYVAAL